MPPPTFPKNPGDGKRNREDEELETDTAPKEDFVKPRKIGRPRKIHKPANLAATSSAASTSSESEMDTTPPASTQVPTHNDQLSNINATTSTTNTSSTNSNATKQFTQHSHKVIYNIATKVDVPRIKMAQYWQQFQYDNDALIIKTKNGFILKSNKDRKRIAELLTTLKSREVILTFSESTDIPQPQKRTHEGSYSCVIKGLEQEITEEEVSAELKLNGIVHRYCRRIIGKSTGTPTSFIRIITSSHEAYSQLLHNKFKYLCKVYQVSESLAPAPLPIPCSKCNKFEHTSDKCSELIKCGKCAGNHNTSICTTTLPEICPSCKKEGHGAWSTKCPNRPRQPIEGLPNVKILSTNKKSAEIDPAIKKNSRIHSPVTIHDHIVDTFITEVNSPLNIDRQALLKKLKERFIISYNIDTCVAFSGNRMFIAMFDLMSPNIIPPVVPTSDVHIFQSQVRNG